jgi:hypothetical protein
MGESFTNFFAVAFRSIEFALEMGLVGLLFVDNKSETTCFAFLLLDLGLKFLCFNTKLLRNPLKFLKLSLAFILDTFTSCFQCSSWSLRMLLRLVTLATSLSIRVLR